MPLCPCCHCATTNTIVHDDDGVAYHPTCAILKAALGTGPFMTPLVRRSLRAFAQDRRHG